MNPNATSAAGLAELRRLADDIEQRLSTLLERLLTAERRVAACSQLGEDPRVLEAVHSAGLRLFHLEGEMRRHHQVVTGVVGELEPKVVGMRRMRLELGARLPTDLAEEVHRLEDVCDELLAIAERLSPRASLATVRSVWQRICLHLQRSRSQGAAPGPTGAA